MDADPGQRPRERGPCHGQFRVIRLTGKRSHPNELDAAGGIQAAVATDRGSPLLDQIDGQITRVTADGAYDGAPTYQTIATLGGGIEVVIPPRSTAVSSGGSDRPHSVIVT
jgi:hypothetical protein